MRRCLGAIAIWFALIVPADAGSLSVLFVGNSFTREHDIPGMVSQITVSTGGPMLDVTDASENGMTLDWHVNEGRALELLSAMDWDVVVLQDFSDVALVEEKRLASVAAARVLGGAAADAGAEVIFFAPWAPRQVPVDRRAEATRQIEAHYAALAKANGGTVAPVGRMWLQHLDQDAAAKLRAPDDHHATASGAYLAAQTISLRILEISKAPVRPNIGWSPAAVGHGLAQRLWVLATGASASLGH